MYPKLKKLGQLMSNNSQYHQAYINKYQAKYDSNNKNKTSINIYKILFPTSFLLLPIIFAFGFDNFITKIITPEIKHKEILVDSVNLNNENYIPNFIKEDKDIINLDDSTELNKIVKTHKKYIKKFDEIIYNYKNNFIKKNKSLEENEVAKLISFKNENLTKNLSQRKKDFIEMILPFSIKLNEKILIERKKLLKVKNDLLKNKTLDKDDQNFLDTIASKYLVKTNNKHKIDIINDLLLSVDVIPNSIVIAQAANESGWGSSRFAQDYNAFFGEYTYNDNIGIEPTRREEGKKHLIKYFSSVEKSVQSYFNNINRHYAYQDFRILRSNFREKNNELNPLLLVNQLSSYAEDSKYIETIKSIIFDNNLKEFDNIKILTSS